MPLINQLRGVRLMDALLNHPALIRRARGEIPYLLTTGDPLGSTWVPAEPNHGCFTEVDPISVG